MPLRCSLVHMKSTKRIPVQPAADIRSNPPEIMSVTELAMYLNQSPRKTWEDVRLGRIPSIKLGGRVLLRRVDIEVALQRLTRGRVD